MPSFVYLPVFIILVYVSGSTINEIETSWPSIIHSTERTFISGSDKETPSLEPSSVPIPPFIVIAERSKAKFTTSILTSSTIATTSLISASSRPLSSLPTTAITTPTTISNAIGFNVFSTRKYEYRTASQSGDEGNVYMNVTNQSGTHAYLPCNVKHLVKKAVSWIRVRDGHILTVDQTTFIADQRFQSIYNPNRERWSLQIKYVQIHDAGSYECQVSTEPKMSARVYLNVIEPKTEPFGEANRHVKAGSQVRLQCIVSGALEAPTFFNWYFDKKQIFLHNQNSWRTEIDRQAIGNNSDKQNTVGSLVIPSVTKKDSGNFTCSPSNSESITFVLHVLNGEYSASAVTSDGPYVLKQNITLIIAINLIASLQLLFTTM